MVSKDSLSYLKSFNKNPIDFQKINKYIPSDDESYSSSSRGSDSSDSFPSPKTPKKRKKYYKEDKFENYEDLYNEMRGLQRQLCEMQIENKKLKFKNIT